MSSWPQGWCMFCGCLKEIIVRNCTSNPGELTCRQMAQSWCQSLLHTKFFRVPKFKTCTIFVNIFCPDAKLKSDLYIFQMTNLIAWVPKFYISWWKWRFFTTCLPNLATYDWKSSSSTFWRYPQDFGVQIWTTNFHYLTEFTI